ncbi:MAG TPA: isoprenylcysteine carboxylmethyltransferase family protein [Rubrivivax sp.]|nr:isoprenylcysteine carboxylmethyltransferase family protein [Rubrivivax sp.]
MSWLNLKIPPPAVGVLVALLMWLVAPLGPPLPLAPETAWTAALVFVAVGLSVDFLGLLSFRAARTTINPMRPQRSAVLVTGGIYRVTRNPMYLGMCSLLLGWAAWLSALAPLAGPPLFIAYMTRFQIRPEEEVLSKIFGAEYERYCTRVRRWL